MSVRGVFLSVSVLTFGSITSAMAADMPVKALKAPPAVSSALYDWTGFYVGGSAGYGWSSSDVTSTGTIISCNPATGGCLPAPGPVATASANAVPFLDTNPQGGLVGLQLGYNRQFGQWVAGIETDISWTNIEGSDSQSITAPVVGFPNNSITGTATAEQRLEYFGTLRGRLGFLPLNSLLVYATGGLAYGRVTSDWTLTQTINGPCSGPCVVAPATSSAGSWRAGWTIGGGLEYAFAPRWSLKGEYLYYDLGSENFSSTINATAGAAAFWTTAFNSSADFKGSIVRVGLNYKFGG